MSLERFDMSGKIVVITGGAGLLGREHAMAVAECGAIPVLLDIQEERLHATVVQIQAEFGIEPAAYPCDVADLKAVRDVNQKILARFQQVDVLINNAAHDVKVDRGDHRRGTRFEDLDLEQWRSDLDVGLTGAYICSRVFGSEMATQHSGVILNIGSVLGITAPDQRIYREEGYREESQPVKPVTYSVVKHAIIGLTKYLATYWAHKGVRANTLCPGGVYRPGMPDRFVEKLTNLIPMGRMAKEDEYRGAVQFMCSEASSYMNGATLSLDGGQTVW